MTQPNAMLFVPNSDGSEELWVSVHKGRVVFRFVGPTGGMGIEFDPKTSVEFVDALTELHTKSVRRLEADAEVAPLVGERGVGWHDPK